MPIKETLNTIDSYLHKSLENSQINLDKLSPFQRILLIADGTLTHILEAFLNEVIVVVKLSEEIVITTTSLLPLEIKEGTAIMKRKILLQGKSSGRHWLYAESTIVLERVGETFKEKLINSHAPIGKLWKEYRTETFKEIITYDREDAGDFSDYFEIKSKDKLLSRTYRVFSNHQPVMMITEKFPENAFIL
ncbi:chorismate pyruvate-lyase family protein [Deltaproteobacteria bacterium TL4]